MEFRREKSSKRRMLLSTKKCIEWVKKYPVLYDPEHKHFRDAEIREGIWRQIAMQTNEDVNELKSRWKNLKDTYRKHILATLDESNEKNYITNWKWAKLMDEFKPYLPITRTSHSSNKNTGESSSNNLETSTDGYEFINTSCSPQEQEDQDSEDVSNFETKPEVYEFVNASYSPQDQQQKTENFANFETNTEVNKSPEFVAASSLPQEQQRKDENFEANESPEFVSASPQKRPQKQQPQPIKTVNKRIKRAKLSASLTEDSNDYVHQIQRLGFTPTEMIFLGYAQTVEQFSLHRQATTKLKIAQIIMEQELLEIAEAEEEN